MLGLSPDVSSELGIPKLGSASQGSRSREVQLTGYNCPASFCLPLMQNSEFLTKKKITWDAVSRWFGAVCKSVTLGEL